MVIDVAYREFMRCPDVGKVTIETMIKDMLMTGNYQWPSSSMGGYM